MRQCFYPSLSKMPLSHILNALSDPARLKIVKILLEKGEQPCGGFRMTVSKSTMSHHFKVLREAGLIQKRGEGTTHITSLRRDEIEARFPGLLNAIAAANKPL